MIYVKKWIWRVYRRLGVWSGSGLGIPEQCVGLRTARDRALWFERYVLVSAVIVPTVDVSVSNRLMIQRLTIAVAAVGVVAFGSLFLYEHLLNQRAEFMVRNVYELSEQQIPTLVDIQERFGKQLKQLDGCTPSECGYTVVLSNRVLAALHTIPYTELKFVLRVRNGLVLETMVDYTTTVNHRYNVVSHVQIDFCKGCQTFAIHP